MGMTGQCLCGAVKFTARDVPHQVGTCHCGQCRRWASGPYFAVRAGRVSFAGEENTGRYPAPGGAAPSPSTRRRLGNLQDTRRPPGLSGELVELNAHSVSACCG